MSNATAVRRAPRASLHDVITALVSAFRRSDVELPEDARELTLSQLRLCFLVRREGPLTMGQVADRFGIGQAAATGLVDRIERQGFLERRHGNGDRRVVECHLTARGEGLLDQITGLHRESLERSLSVLDEAELTELNRLLAIVAARNPAATNTKESA